MIKVGKPNQRSTRSCICSILFIQCSYNSSYNGHFSSYNVRTIERGSYNHCMNFVGTPPGKPGRLSGYKYQAFEMKHQNIWKNIRLWRMNTTMVITVHVQMILLPNGLKRTSGVHPTGISPQTSCLHWPTDLLPELDAVFA